MIEDERSRRRSHLAPVFILFVLMQLACFAPRLNSDGAYYFEFLRSMVCQGDLNFDDEREFFTWEWVPVFREFIPGDWKDTGYPPNIFSVGPALFWIPLYLAGNVATAVINGAGGTLPENGYNIVQRFFPMLSALLAGLAAILFIEELLRMAGYRRENRAAALFFLLGASHWSAFIFVTPAFSHALSVCAVSLFYLVWFRWRDEDWGPGGHFLYGILAGVIILIRWQNAFCLVLPFVDAVSSTFSAPNSDDFRERFFRWLCFAFGAFLAVSPQLVVTWTLYGTPITDPQGKGGMHWFHPRFTLVLFEGIKGLYSVNPILLPATLFFPFVFFRSFRMGWGLTLVFAIQLYINSVRRDWSGVGFGMRRFLNLMPVFAVGITILFETLGDTMKKIPRYGLYAAGVLLIVWNNLLMAQYYFSELGAPWTTLPRAEMIHRQFTESPGLLVTLMGTSLMGSCFSGNPGSIALIVFALAMTIYVMKRILQAQPLAPVRFFTARSMSVTVAVVFMALSGYLFFMNSRAEFFNAIDLNDGKKFGFLRKLRLNPDSGYFGMPGGVVFGPGREVSIIREHCEYVRNRFLELGTLMLDKRHLRSDGNMKFFFPKPPGASQLVVISRLRDAESSRGMPIAKITVHTQRKGPFTFPVRAGFETGVSGDTSVEKAERLPMDFPAVRFLERGAEYFRMTYHFPERVSVARLEIAFMEKNVEWEVHGMAFH